jgi:hypothetical protein
VNRTAQVESEAGAAIAPKRPLDKLPAILLIVFLVSVVTFFLWGVLIGLTDTAAASIGCSQQVRTSMDLPAFEPVQLPEGTRGHIEVNRRWLHETSYKFMPSQGSSVPLAPMPGDGIPLHCAG